MAVIFNPDAKKGIVLGSYYGGEMKKGIFGLMNYWYVYLCLLLLWQAQSVLTF
jgi:ATP-dependent phosphoenolpyruvate carboxykinase